MKKLLALALAGAMMASLVGCSSSDSSSSSTTTTTTTTATEETVEVTTLIGAHVNSETSSFHMGMTYFKEKLEEVSGGSMTLEIHPNGELGGDEAELIEKVATKTVDVIVVSPADLSNAVPQVDFLALPFIYENMDHWVAAIQSDSYGGYFADIIDDNGSFHFLTYFMCGVRSIFAAEPIESLESFAGSILRVKGSENVNTMWVALGANPSSLAYNELYSGLENNVVDAAENDIANILDMKFYEPAPYTTLTEHDIATRFLVIGSSVYNGLSAEQQAWVDEAAEYSSAMQWEYDIAYADECYAELEAEGAIFCEIDTTEWIEAATPVLSEIAEDLGVLEAYQSIIGMDY